MAPIQPGGAQALLVLSRIFWMMVGPILLAALAYNVIKTGNGWATSADVWYLAILCLLMAVRAFEFRYPNPQRATGEPATPRDLRIYLIGALTIGLILWAGANVIGNGYLAP